MASRYEAAQPFTSKESVEVSKAFQRIYRRGPLKWPRLLQVDPGREFMGAVTKVMENNKTAIRRGRTEIHRDQAIVERFNKTLAERLFGHQYAVEMRLTTAYSRPVGVNEKKLPLRVNVRYLYQPGELEGSGRRATDPIWSLKVYNIKRILTKPDEPVVYYFYDGPKRGFVRKELMVVPPDTQLPLISL